MSESVLKSNMTLQPTVLPNGKAHSRKLTTMPHSDQTEVVLLHGGTGVCLFVKVYPNTQG